MAEIVIATTIMPMDPVRTPAIDKENHPVAAAIVTIEIMTTLETAQIAVRATVSQAIRHPMIRPMMITVTGVTVPALAGLIILLSWTIYQKG